MLNYDTRLSSTESYAIRKLNKRVDCVEACNSLQTQCENCLQYQIDCNECCTNDRIERIEEALCHCECWICVCTMCANVEDVTVCGDTCICGPMRMYCGEVQCDTTFKDNVCVECDLSVGGTAGANCIVACTGMLYNICTSCVCGNLPVECDVSVGGDIGVCGDLCTSQGKIAFGYCADTETITIG